MSHRLFLLRHAKSDWNGDVGDQQRPLSKRGRKNAVTMGRWMLEQKLIPECIITSTAERALQTCDYLQQGFQGKLNIPTEDRHLYLADSDSMLDIIAQQDEQAESLMLVGHNPGMDELLCYLCGDDVPFTHNGKLMTTATLAVVELANGWRHINSAENTLLQLARPREIANAD